MTRDLAAHIATNAFHVLALSPEASRQEAERAGAKLLAMLQLGLHAAAQYQSPLGTHIRSESAVRESLAALRDPRRRALHAVIASLTLPAWATPEAPAAAATTRDEAALRKRDDPAADCPPWLRPSRALDRSVTWVRNHFAIPFLQRAFVLYPTLRRAALLPVVTVIAVLFGALSVSRTLGSTSARSVALAWCCAQSPSWTARCVAFGMAFAPFLLHAPALATPNELADERPVVVHFVMALSLAQHQRPSLAAVAWLERALVGTRAPLRGVGIATWALLQLARGDLQTGMSWLASINLLSGPAAPEALRRIAAEWLALHAAHHGDWRRVRELAEGRDWPRSRVLVLLGRLAVGSTPRGKLARAALWLHWLETPGRCATRPLVLQIKLAGQAATRAPQAAPPLAREHDVSTKHLDPADLADVVELAHTWENTLRVQRRIACVTRPDGSHPDETAIAEVRTLMIETLSRALPAQGAASVDRAPHLVREAEQMRRDRRLADVEQTLAQLRRVRADGRALVSIEQWRTLLSLEEHYQRAVDAGDHVEAHALVRNELMDHAFSLYNEHGERAVANVLFRFLESEAVEMGDTEAASLARHNASCSL